MTEKLAHPGSLLKRCARLAQTLRKKSEGQRSGLFFYSAVALLSLFFLLFHRKGGTDALALWILAGLMAGTHFYHDPLCRIQSDFRKLSEQLMVWLPLGTALLTLFFFDNPLKWTFFLLLLSLSAYFFGSRQTLYGAPTLFIYSVLIPSFSQLTILLSFPLSRISTAIAAFFLKISGMDVSYHLSVLMVGEKEIAVTAACSGIELLNALLLIGFLIVYCEHRRQSIRILHYCCLLPALIFSNSLRLYLVTMLYRQIGEKAFEEPLHSLFGYGVAGLSVLLLYFAGKVFPEKQETAAVPQSAEGSSSSCVAEPQPAPRSEAASIEDAAGTGAVPGIAAIQIFPRAAVLRHSILFAAALPFLLSLPRIFRTWKASPLDANDWIFFVLSAALFLLRRKTILSAEGSTDRGEGIRNRLLPLFLALCCALLYPAALLKDIYFFQYTAALFLFVSCAGIVFGTLIFFRLLPLFIIIALGLPSTSYWTGYYARVLQGNLALDVDGFLLKLFAATVFAVIFLFFLKKIRPYGFCYFLLFSICLAAIPVFAAKALTGNPVILKDNLLKTDRYLIRMETTSAQDQRFFAGNRIQRLTLMPENPEEAVELLHVAIEKDIHMIHPAELCLRSAQKEVLHSREKILRIHQHPLAVQELFLNNRNGTPCLLYSFYSGPEWSSGNFLLFRKTWSRGTRWYSFQIMTALGNGSREDAEKRLNEALEDLLLFPVRQE